MARDDLDDAELVRRANQGDADAFEALYRRHRDWVVSLAWRLCRNRDDALDVLQESFSWLFGRFPGFTLTSSMRAWLYPVVRNACISLARKRRNVVPLDRAGIEPAAEPEPIDWTPEFERRIAGLSEAHREVLRLRFILELRLEEIAAALDLPLGTVKSRLHHALRTLAADDPGPAAGSTGGTPAP
ncbi:MAG: sigma-70 family RNA polymerase sigma factor [Deltaproteobacteria bacterium]|nr:sigma-70 family RNA polymerase sigma factor [Deltaproteobacteria bacterium]